MMTVDASSTECEVLAHWDLLQQEVREPPRLISSYLILAVWSHLEFSSEHIFDEVVHLVEHHEVNGQTRASVLGGRVACQPGEGVVLLKHKSVTEGGRALLTISVILM